MLNKIKKIVSKEKMTLLERKGPNSLSSLNLIAKRNEKVQQMITNSHLVRKLINVQSRYNFHNRDMMDHRKFYLSANKHHYNNIDPLLKQVANNDRYGKELLKRMSRNSSRSKLNILSN